MLGVSVCASIREREREGGEEEEREAVVRDRQRVSTQSFKHGAFMEEIPCVLTLFCHLPLQIPYLYIIDLLCS